MISREGLVAEQALREIVQKAIKKAMKENKQSEQEEENVLREVVRKMLLQEKTPVGDEAPHERRGPKNVLYVSSYQRYRQYLSPN